MSPSWEEMGHWLPWCLDRFDGYSRWTRYLLSHDRTTVIFIRFGPTVPERGCKPGDS